MAVATTLAVYRFCTLGEVWDAPAVYVQTHRPFVLWLLEQEMA